MSVAVSVSVSVSVSVCMQLLATLVILFVCQISVALQQCRDKVDRVLRNAGLSNTDFVRLRDRRAAEWKYSVEAGKISLKEFQTLASPTRQPQQQQQQQQQQQSSAVVQGSGTVTASADGSGAGSKKV